MFWGMLFGLCLVYLELGCLLWFACIDKEVTHKAQLPPFWRLVVLGPLSLLIPWLRHRL